MEKCRIFYCRICCLFQVLSITNIPALMNKLNIQYFAVTHVEYYRVAANRKSTVNGMNE